MPGVRAGPGTAVPGTAVPRTAVEAQVPFVGSPFVRFSSMAWRTQSATRSGRTSASFDYAGPLSETVLLGSVACRFPKTTLEWNAQALRFTNVREANRYVRRTYRHGWEVKGLS